MHGIVIAGTHSGCGKTTITLGMLAALKKKGMAVQSFKAGPDFIDTGLHRMITGRPSRNLDVWMCGETYVRDCFYKYSQDADIAVIEGVMGMYDGEYNTANLACLLGLPVILVVDSYGMAESAGAIVKGFANPPSPPFDKGGMGGFVASVIFNRVASEKHYARLRESVYDVPVLGYLPRDLNFEIPHRHLGLTVAEEKPITDENIERLAHAVLKYVDVEKITEMQDKNKMQDTRYTIHDTG
jgi:cobyrinic acid a,c-diamide synthase